MAAKTSMTVKVHIDGVRETLAAFRQLPKDANDELRNAAMIIALSLAGRARTAAMADSPQAALMAPTVTARRDRVPVVQAGGSQRVGRHGAPAWRILFASEFGMNARSGWYAADRYDTSFGQQYKSHRGRAGYWFFPLVESEAPMISREFNAAADRIERAFGRGGEL